LVKVRFSRIVIRGMYSPLVRTDSLVVVGVRMGNWHNPTPTNAIVLDYANGLDEIEECQSLLDLRHGLGSLRDPLGRDERVQTHVGWTEWTLSRSGGMLVAELAYRIVDADHLGGA
jgi:hypothetical protein